MENRFGEMLPVGSSAPTLGAVERSRGLAARYTNMVLGAWIALSGFVLGADSGLRIHDLVLGLLIIGVEVIALRIPVARFGNLALSAWLAFAILRVFEPSSAMRWNNLFVAVLVFLGALVPNTTPRRAKGSSGRDRRVLA